MAELAMTMQRGTIDDETGAVTLEIVYEDIDYSDPPAHDPIRRVWHLQLPGEAVEQ